MSQVSFTSDQNNHLLLTKNQIGRDFRLNPNKVQSWLNALGVEVVEYNGRKLYPLIAIADKLKAAHEDGDEFPTQAERLACYRADRQQIENMKYSGDLIEAAQLLEQLSNGFKALIAALESIYDVFERDMNAEPEVLERVEQIIVGGRDALYKAALQFWEDNRSK